jgi:menaquinone-dependent protoporphyrinogen oxidase
MPKDEAVDVPDMVRVTAARGRRTFAGKLVRGQLAFTEKAMITALRAQEGDFRDWRAVEDWAATIAEVLTRPVLAWHAVPATGYPLSQEEGVPP